MEPGNTVKLNILTNLINEINIKKFKRNQMTRPKLTKNNK